MKQCVPLLVALALVVPVVSAALTVTPVPEASRPRPLGPAGPAALCTAGVPGPATWLVGGYFQSPDTYFTRIDPQACGCSNGGLVTAAHVQLSVPQGAPHFSLSVSVVAADLSNPSCPAPLPQTVLCGPFTRTSTSFPAGVWQLDLPLGESCCLNGTAMLAVTIETDAWEVDLVADSGCQPCVSWSLDPTPVDLCSVGFPGKPVMWVDVNCCPPNAARTDTWGALKTLYR